MTVFPNARASSSSPILLALVMTILFVSTAEARTEVGYDPTFGTNGLVTAELGPDNLSPIVSSKSLLRDHRGRIVVGEANDNGWQVRRYFSNGNLDPSFGDGGKVVIESWGGNNWSTGANLASAALRPDGRILLVGFVRPGSGQTSYMVLKQLLPDGSPDTSFGWIDGGLNFGAGNGAVSTALRPDGRIVIGGFSELTSTGSGYNGVVIGLTADGNRDPSFRGGESIVIPGDGSKSSYFPDVEVLPNGQILAAGTKANRFLVIKLRKDGNYVPSFGKNGRAVFGKDCRCSIARAMDRDSKGRIVVTGQVRGPNDDKAGYGLTVRFKANGDLDRSFGNDGLVRLYATSRTGSNTTNLYDTTIDSKGGIWVTGSAGPEFNGNRRAVTARYLPSGKLDKRFFKKGKLITRLGESSVASQVLALGRQIYLSGRYKTGGTDRLFLRRFVSR
ncbi:MAG: hypothetical protein JJE13_08940 [Thermoleophilia bacterium]|nr:hypothetical protein [Thermoleophilia bacterium]